MKNIMRTSQRMDQRSRSILSITRRRVAAVVIAVATGMIGAGDETRAQSVGRHDRLAALPASGLVTLDGNLKDWDHNVGIQSVSDTVGDQAKIPSQTSHIVSDGSETSRVPAWDARALGPLPWQGIACADVSEDGSVAALGTISPPGDPNLIVLDADGRVVSQRRVGLRWVDEVAVAPDGRLVAAVSGTPEGTAGDAPRLYAFLQGQPLTDVAGVQLASLSFRGRLGEARSNHFGGRLFHFGDHSNHLSPALAKSDGTLAVASDDGVFWLGSGPAASAVRAAYGQRGFRNSRGAM
jgi:hypothetical protein